MARSLSRRIEAVATLEHAVRWRLYEYVTKQSVPVSRDQAAAALHLSRTAVALHLDRLAKVGLLKTEYRRLTGRTGAGAGRPAKLYRRSKRDFSVVLPPREHELLASFLAGSVAVTTNEIVRSEPARQFGQALGARARHRLRGTPTNERLLSCVETVLEDVGFAPESRRGDGLWMRDCPFDPLSRRFQEAVCGAGVALVEGIVSGVEAHDVRVGRDPDRDRCCVHLTSISPG
jgi:predicted ArsR family transcriptional regulator